MPAFYVLKNLRHALPYAWQTSYIGLHLDCLKLTVSLFQGQELGAHFFGPEGCRADIVNSLARACILILHIHHGALDNNNEIFLFKNTDILLYNHTDIFKYKAAFPPHACISMNFETFLSFQR
jgi:hypothetical protein